MAKRKKESKWKKWWKNHWDEVMLVVGTILVIVLIYLGLKYG